MRVLVTGGNDGMGRMMVEALVARGARVYITARAAPATPVPGVRACFVADLGSEASCERVAALLGEHEDALDVLVNNAARRSADDALAAPAGTQQRAWEGVFGVTLFAAFFLTKALLPMLARAATTDQPARVINVSSISGIGVPSYDANAYIAAKAGLNHLTRALAAQLAPRRVTVNAIAPGVIKSRARQADVPAEYVPLGRVGDAADVAGVTEFLCSRGAAYITGQVIALDGGLLVKAHF